MDRRDVILVQESFADIARASADFGAMLYERLFELVPDARPLFGTDLGVHGRKLFSALASAVAALDRLEPIFPTIDALGLRHRAYGVVERHYYAFGGALIWVLERLFGPAFTPELQHAWRQAYGILSTRMMAAARLNAA